MTSLRRQLAVGLLLAFTLVLAAGGVLAYLSIRSTLARQFDDLLLARAVTMASCVKVDRGNIESHFSEHVAHGISAPAEVGYFRVWVMGSGRELNRSASPVNFQLPIIYSMSKMPTFFNLTLPDGAQIRGLGLYFSPDVEGDKGTGDNDRDEDNEHGENGVRDTRAHVPQIGLVVAEDCENLTKTLDRLVFIIVATSLPMLAAAFFSVRLVLRRGLRPLSRLAEQARHIGVDSLRTRFPTEGLPVELTPISGRLNDLLSRLESSFSEMSEYAGKVTHELRTPLAILRLKIEQAGAEIPPELAEEFQTQLQHLANVVDQSLCIARAEQGRLRLSPCAIDLAELVADVAEDFSLLANEQNRQVIFKKPARRLEINVDPKYTRQIVHNLLSNALKHGQGDISIKLSGGAAHCAMTILNSVPGGAAPARETLGLGLRVVDSLLQLQPEIKFRRRHGRRFYAVRLSFPAARQAGPPLPLPGKSAFTAA